MELVPPPVTLSDQDAINLLFDKVEALFATSNPDQAAIDTFSPSVTNDFLENGGNKTQLFDDWMASASPFLQSLPIGLQLNAIITADMDVSATSYQKGYWIDLHLSSSLTPFTLRTSVVFDGTNWLWYGNQQWISTDLKFAASKWFYADSTEDTGTGLDIGGVKDNYYYASNLGVKSGILTGPGLPAEGMALLRYLPETGFDFVINGEFYYYLTDSVIDTIPANAEYTISLYVEDPAVVTLSDTPLVSYTVLIPKPPIRNSELTPALFPSIVIPTSHALADAKIPGMLNVEWLNTASSDVTLLGLGWGDADKWNIAGEFLSPGTTSSIVDTTSAPLPPVFALLILIGEDDDGRLIKVFWSFE